LHYDFQVRDKWFDWRAEGLRRRAYFLIVILRNAARLALLWALLCISLSAVATSVDVGGWQLQDAGKVEADGELISRPNFAPRDWYKATVPGTVLTSLADDGVFPEPLYGENNRSIPESLCRTSYWYRTTVSVPAGFKGRRVWLKFQGINYIANVWVNGRHVGDIRGAFARGDFDVTGDVSPGSDATIAVQIQPPGHPSEAHDKTLATGTGRNGGAMGADGPTFLAAVGWDWMPAIRDRDMGIWQPVTLEDSGPVVVRDPYVRTILPLPKSNSAAITVQTSLENVSNKIQRGFLVGSVPGTKLSFKLAVSLAPGETQSIDVPALQLPHPKLWWPNGYGPQNLYKLDCAFVQSEGTSDFKGVSFGVRSISYFRTGDKKLTIIVNGVPIACKGGNWGMDEAMKRIPHDRLEAQIRLHRDANFTMIRNWIGMSTEEDFYDLCDRYGILVWDDFWLANPSDGPDPLDPTLFLDNAREKLLRYRTHPSIALWCGRNEGDAPPDIEPGLQDLVAKLDPDRMFQRNSAAYNGVGGGGPYSSRPLESYFSGRDAFHTEIGAPSIPTLQAIQGMMPEKDWWPINDDWAEHDFCKGAQRGDRFPEDLAKRYGPFSDLPSFVRESQLANYETYRGMFEGRFSKLFDPISGVLLWMSNPAQPSFVWQVYSYDLEPNAAFFGARSACEPLHIQYNPTTTHVELVNSLAVAFPLATASYEVIGLDGRISFYGSIAANVKPSGTTDVGQLSPSFTPPPGVWFLRLRLTAKNGSLLSRNFYWESTSGDCSELQKLPPAKVDCQVRSANAPKGSVGYEVTLRNSGSSIALMTHLQLRDAASGKRILPVYYSDNYVTLLPGEEWTITVEAPSKMGADARPTFWLDGWNIPERAATFDAR
jgi:hypothetical protein